MPSLTNWDPYKTHVQGGLPDGNFVNAQFIVVCAGPPHLADIGGAGLEDSGNDLVYPIGFIQNFAVGQGKQFSKIFEIGSDRAYFLAGRTNGQISLSRIYYHGASLLRTMYAWHKSSPVLGGGVAVDQLYAGPAITALDSSFASGFAGVAVGDSKALHTGTNHVVRIPPGYNNLFLNLASDLFSQPLGLMLVIHDNEDNEVGSVYVENCVVPNYNFGFDSMGLVVQESATIQYERIVPLDRTQVLLVDKLLDDEHGAAAW